jgi:regulatory protein
MPMKLDNAGAGDRRPKSLLRRAVALLARRDHSRAELARKLARYSGEENAGDIGRVLDELERNGLLSDQRFARGVTRSRSHRFGDARIRHDLRRFGVSDETGAAALRSLEQSEFARAQAVQAKRFAELPASIAERAKQTRFLQSRGFLLDTIVAVLRGKAEDPADG